MVIRVEMVIMVGRVIIVVMVIMVAMVIMVTNVIMNIRYLRELSSSWLSGHHGHIRRDRKTRTNGTYLIFQLDFPFYLRGQLPQFLRCFPLLVHFMYYIVHHVHHVLVKISLLKVISVGFVNPKANQANQCHHGYSALSRCC